MTLEDPVCKSFVERIKADPVNLALQLQFADWLEENGEADWGEYIRVEAERDRLSARAVELWNVLPWEKRTALMVFPDISEAFQSGARVQRFPAWHSGGIFGRPGDSVEWRS